MTLRKSFSLYSLLSVVVGAQAAILLFVHHFGSAGVDAVAGSILGGLAVLAVVGHVWLQSLVIGVPASVYGTLTKVMGAAVGILAAGGIVTQYVGTVTPTLTPVVAVILQGVALLTSLFAQLFKVSVAAKALRTG